MKNTDIQNTNPTAQHLEESQSEWMNPANTKTARKGFNTLLAALPRFSDKKQKRAAGNIVKFLAALIILTLVARGTAGATLAKVDVENPAGGEIIESVTGNAIVNAEDLTGISVPEGLTVLEILVGTGQSIERGDAVAKFDMDEVKDKLERENSALDGMRLNLGKLEREEPVDTSGIKSAQLNVKRAKDDYNTAKKQGETEVANAKASLDAAKANESKKKDDLETAPAKAEADARKAWEEAVANEQEKLDELNNTAPEDEAFTRQAWEEAKKDTQEKKKALDHAFSDAEQAARTEWEAAKAETQKAEVDLKSAQDKAKQDLLSASRMIEDANLSLSKVEQDQSKMEQQAEDTTAQNDIDAKVQQLDIEKQQELVSELQMLADNEGVLHADIAGVVNKTIQPDDVTGTEPLITLADSTGVFEAELRLDKTEAEKLTTGNECEVTTGGGSMYYTPTVTGTISSISSPDEEGLVSVTVRLPEGEWTGGQSVEVQVVQSRASYDMCIPLSALRSDSSGYYIFTVEQQSTVLGVENVILQTPVTVQAMDDSSAAISGPVERNASVVTNSNKTIDAGDRVRVNES